MIKWHWGRRPQRKTEPKPSAHWRNSTQFWKLKSYRDVFFFVFFFHSWSNQSSVFTLQSLNRLSACGNDKIQVWSKPIKIDFFIWLHNNGCCCCLSTWGIMRKLSIWVSVQRIRPMFVAMVGIKQQKPSVRACKPGRIMRKSCFMRR